MSSASISISIQQQHLLDDSTVVTVVLHILRSVGTLLQTLARVWLAPNMGRGVCPCAADSALDGRRVICRAPPPHHASRTTLSHTVSVSCGFGQWRHGRIADMFTVE